MIVAMCCTRNWYVYLTTAIYSLFKHNNVKKLYLFIEDDEIKWLKDNRIEFININNLEEYITPNSPNYNTQYSKLSYMRCIFSKVLKEDKLLYVDADAIVVDNIDDLWNMDFEGNELIGIKEPGEWDKHLNTYGMNNNYINSGVLLMDLKGIKEQKLDDSMIYLLNHSYFRFPDQDVINLVFRNRIKYVSNIYNSTETTGFVDNAKIVHYIRGNKGWIKESPRSEIWFNCHKEMIGGNKMENYLVRATKNFNDYEGADINNPQNKFEVREAGKSEWLCTGERYEYLKEHGAVELIEIQKIELPKEEKPIKKKTSKK